MDNIYFVTSRFANNQVVNGVVHVDMNLETITAGLVTCEKVLIGYKFLVDSNKTNLFVTDDKDYYKYLCSYEIHEEHIREHGVLYAAQAWKDAYYMKQALEVIKDKDGKKSLDFISNHVENSIPSTEDWFYINSKLLVRRQNK